LSPALTHFFHFTDSLSSLISQSSRFPRALARNSLNLQVLKLHRRWISSKATGISSSSFLPTSISLSLSYFLFCFTADERRLSWAPPPHRHREIPDQVRSHRIWWDLARSSEISPDLVRSRQIRWDFAGFWLDLADSAAAPPSTSPVLSNIGVFADFFVVFFFFFFFFFFCGCYGEYFVAMICWWVDFLFDCCCNGKNPWNPTVTTCQNRSTDPPEPTTLTDGQRVWALQTRLCRVG
jgi:hypothetical protein